MGTEAQVINIHGDRLGEYELTELAITGRQVWRHVDPATGHVTYLHYSAAGFNWVIGPDIVSVHGNADVAAITSGPSYEECPYRVANHTEGAPPPLLRARALARPLSSLLARL